MKSDWVRPSSSTKTTSIDLIFEEMMMIRKAFLMTLKPDCQEEYERRHNPIWPELEAVLKNHGVSNYSIFLDRNTDRLFAYAEIESEERWQQIAQTEVCRHWWAHMNDLMLTNPDNSPLASELDEVFHLN
jgi:L-rhamnose mutarotase